MSYNQNISTLVGQSVPPLPVYGQAGFQNSQQPQVVDYQQHQIQQQSQSHQIQPQSQSHQIQSQSHQIQSHQIQPQASGSQFNYTQNSLNENKISIPNNYENSSQIAHIAQTYANIPNNSISNYHNVSKMSTSMNSEKTLVTETLDIIDFQKTEIKPVSSGIDSLNQNSYLRDYETLQTINLLDQEDKFTLFLYQSMLKEHNSACQLIANMYISKYPNLKEYENFNTYLLTSLLILNLQSKKQLDSFIKGEKVSNKTTVIKGETFSLEDAFEDEESLDEVPIEKKIKLESNPFDTNNHFLQFPDMYNFGQSVAKSFIPVDFAPFELSLKVVNIPNKKRNKNYVCVRCSYKKTIFGEIKPGKKINDQYNYYLVQNADELVHVVEHCIGLSTIHQKFGFGLLNNQEYINVANLQKEIFKHHEFFNDKSNQPGDYLVFLLFDSNDSTFFSTNTFKLSMFCKGLFTIPLYLLDSKKILNDHKESFLKDYPIRRETLKQYIGEKNPKFLKVFDKVYLKDANLMWGMKFENLSKEAALKLQRENDQIERENLENAAREKEILENAAREKEILENASKENEQK